MILLKYLALLIFNHKIWPKQTQQTWNCFFFLCSSALLLNILWLLIFQFILIQFIFPSGQFLHTDFKFWRKYSVWMTLFSVGITSMFSPPEGNTSMFRCFATIAMPFFLSLMTLSCNKHVFLSTGLCVFVLPPSDSEPPSQCTHSHSHLQYKHTPSKPLYLWSRLHLYLRCEQFI